MCQTATTDGTVFLPSFSLLLVSVLEWKIITFCLASTFHIKAIRYGEVVGGRGRFIHSYTFKAVRVFIVTGCTEACAKRWKILVLGGGYFDAIGTPRFINILFRNYSE